MLRTQLASLLAILASSGAQVGCHRIAADQAGPSRGSVDQSLRALQGRLRELEAEFSALRQQVETVPPDRPGFSEVRAQFYATEEARGITDAKVSLLAGRLRSASGAGTREELRKLSKDIAETDDEVRQIDQLHTSLSSRLRALQRPRTGRGD